MSQAEDIDAINRHIMGTATKTSKATSLKDSWLKWYDNLSWYSKSFDTATYDEARNRRNDFNIANATNADARQAVLDQARKGITSEEASGNTRRMTSEGRFPEADAPLIPAEYKVVAAVAVIGGALVLAYGIAGAMPAIVASFVTGRARHRELNP